MSGTIGNTTGAPYRVRTLAGLDFEAGSETTLLNAALAHGLHFEYSCNNGQCGVCKTKLIEGRVVELRPQTALTEEDIQAGRVLICCCAPASDVLIDAVDLGALRDIEIKTFPARINSIVHHTRHIVEVALRLPPSANFRFLEGQYVDVMGPGGVRRSYSLANSADETVLKLYIRERENGVLSRYWFHEAKENDLLRIEGPKGSFFLREMKRHVVFLATGTGIAPIKAMLDRLDRRGGEMEDVTCSLYWGNRHPEEFFWEPEYTNILVNYVPVLSRPNASWSGRIGYVQDSLLEDVSDLAECRVYACGSPEMIRSASHLLAERGLPEGCFHSDAFVSS